MPGAKKFTGEFGKDNQQAAFAIDRLEFFGLRPTTFHGERVGRLSGVQRVKPVRIRRRAFRLEFLASACVRILSKKTCAEAGKPLRAISSSGIAPAAKIIDVEAQGSHK